MQVTFHEWSCARVTSNHVRPQTEAATNGSTVPHRLLVELLELHLERPAILATLYTHYGVITSKNDLRVKTPVS